jgi:hypothetical protein
MTSLRQIEANRRNARLSTGPVTDEGKLRSRQNAVRHGLTAETVIGALEDAQDYAAFELAVIADYEAQSAVERELVLRLASLLWRLRRATAIESGLFKIQAEQILQFRQRRAIEDRQDMVEGMCRDDVTPEELQQDICEPSSAPGRLSLSSSPASAFDDLTRSYLRITNLRDRPLDRLSRYECTLWRQARQTLLALQNLDRRKSTASRKKFRESTLW